MRRILLGCVSMLALAAMGCGGDDPATVYADIQYQVRCMEFGMCSGIPDRDFCGLNGATSNCDTPPSPANYDIRCNARETGGMLVFNLSARDNVDPDDTYGVSFRNLTVGAGGGMPLGNGCTVEIEEEDGNLFTGRCGASPMTNDAQPCFVSSVSIGDSPAGRTVSFTMMCSDLPLEADTSRKREVTGPGSSTSPATFMITACAGI